MKITPQQWIEVVKLISTFIHTYIVTLYEKYGYRYDTLPECLRVYLAYTRSAKEISYFTDRLKNKLCRPLYIYRIWKSPGIVKYHLIGRSSPDFAEKATLEERSNAERLG
jgi:hypothetical protein